MLVYLTKGIGKPNVSVFPTASSQLLINGNKLRRIAILIILR